MIRTIAGIFISLAILISASVWESKQVENDFQLLENTIQTLHQKTEDGTATHEDGEAIEVFWQKKKKKLHLLLPHSAVQQIDYELNEALGYLYQGNFQDALPKMEVLLQATEVVRQNFSLAWGNIF